MKKPTTKSLLTAAILAASTSLLVACGEPEPPTPGQHLDSAIDATKEQAAQIERKMENAGAEAERKGEQAGAQLEQKADAIAQAAEDSTITAEVKAKIVQAENLKTLDISVETDKGVVVLTGQAPSEVAVANASAIARSVEGVKDVDNRLVIASR